MYTLQVWASGFWYVLFLFWLFLKHFRKLFFLDALGLCCFETAFSSCSEQVYCSLQCMGPTHCWWLLLLQSPSSRHLQQLQVTGFRAWTQSLWCLCGACCVCMLRGRWNLPGPEIEPISPALADGFLTFGPPGKTYACMSVPKREVLCRGVLGWLKWSQQQLLKAELWAASPPSSALARENVSPLSCCSLVSSFALPSPWAVTDNKRTGINRR